MANAQRENDSPQSAADNRSDKEHFKQDNMRKQDLLDFGSRATWDFQEMGKSDWPGRNAWSTMGWWRPASVPAKFGV